MRRIAIIPARGGSKRIPRKNIKPFHGIPALTRVIETVAKTGLFETIHVSTDDPEIAEIAAETGYQPPFLRPEHLSDDDTPIRSAVRWTLQRLGDNGDHYDTAVLVYATALLLEPHHLIAASQAFDGDPEHQPLLSVVEIGTPLERLFIEREGRLTPPNPTDFAKNSQNLTPALSDAGAFCFYSADQLLKDEDGAKPLAFRGFKLPRWVGLDIDTAEDWQFAEHLFAAIHTQKGQPA